MCVIENSARAAIAQQMQHKQTQTSVSTATRHQEHMKTFVKFTAIQKGKAVAASTSPEKFQPKRRKMNI
jgi:hypothetical protein